MNFDYTPEFPDENLNTDGESGFTADNRNGYSLAMAYVPYQDFSDYFTVYEDALDNGSLFKNLIKTFTNGKYKGA